MKKRLYLIRHGQTLFNLRKKIQGASDSPLTVLGRQQPVRVREYFEQNNIDIDHYYCSTSERASDTLEIIAPGKQYTRLKGIKEMNFGILEGESEDLHQPRSEEQKTWGDLYVKFGGESADQVQERLSKTLIEIMEKPDHKNVMAISHGGACWLFTLRWFPEVDRNKVKFSNCCVLVWDYEDGVFTFVESIEDPEGTTQHMTGPTIIDAIWGLEA